MLKIIKYDKKSLHLKAQLAKVKADICRLDCWEREGQYIALRPTKTDGLIDVFYCHQKIKTLDLRGR